MKEVWDIISLQKDLDLPAHKVMVAHIRCKDIAREQLAAIKSDQAWQALLSAAKDGKELMETFKQDAEGLIESCVYGYRTDAMYFVDTVREEQQAELVKALRADLHDGFVAQREALRQTLVGEFRQALYTASSSAEHAVQAAARAKSSELLARYSRALPS